MILFELKIMNQYSHTFYDVRLDFVGSSPLHPKVTALCCLLPPVGIEGYPLILGLIIF